MDSTSTIARPALRRAAATIAVILTAAGALSIARAQNFFSPKQPPQAVSPNDYTPLPRPGSATNVAPAFDPTAADAFRFGGPSNSAYLDALWQEEFNGNPESALHDYQTLVDRYDAQRKRAGEDLLKLGELEHAKGHSNAARACFARILREFVDFPQLTESAREYLAIRGAEPEALSGTGGIGVALSAEGNYPRVQQILPEGAVAKDGRIQVGDCIAGVGQEGGDITLTSHLKIEQIVPMIRGPIGATVRLLVAPASATIGSTSANSDDLSGARIVELRRTPLAASERPAQATSPNPFGIGAASVGSQADPRESAKALDLLERRVKLLEEQIALTKRNMDLGMARAAELDALRKNLDNLRQQLPNDSRTRGTPDGQPNVSRP